MDAEKIDLLCCEHMNGLTTVWAVTKCLEDIFNFLNICSMEDIILPRERNELIKHYNSVASEKIVAILDEMDEDSINPPPDCWGCKYEDLDGNEEPCVNCRAGDERVPIEEVKPVE